MPVDSNAVAVAVTGAVYRGQSGAAAPTGVSGALTNYDEMGWISEDGITRAMPGAGESTVIVGWQNGAQVRVVRAASTENPTFQFTMLETSKDSLAFADRLARAPIHRVAGTSISEAIDFSLALFSSGHFLAARRVIVISGDGSNNQGR